MQGGEGPGLEFEPRQWRSNEEHGVGRDLNDRMLAIANGMNASLNQGFAYDAMGRVSTITRPGQAS